MQRARCTLWSRDLQNIPPTHVNFARSLELAGLEFVQEFDRLVLRLRWRTLRPIDRRLTCFAHLQGVDGPHQQWMDHELPDLRPGEEAHERVFFELPDPTPRSAQVRLGLYDAGANLRWPIWSSSLPTVDECTAVVCSLGGQYSAESAGAFPPPMFWECNVRWIGGVALMRYGVSRLGPRIWLTLDWSAERRLRSRWRFFGHAVADRVPGRRIWASFDQDLAPAAGAWEQNIVAVLPEGAPEALELAFGIFDVKTQQRLSIADSDLPSDGATRRVFLPLAGETA